MKHCCNNMQFFIKENQISIGYDAKFREYYIELKPKCGGSRQLIYHCPWCGKSLPNNLRDLWFDTIRSEYGLENPCDDEKKIPAKFKTDEWWKERGL